MRTGIYTIPVTGLKEGRHLYEFEVESNFFEREEESEIKECDIRVEVILIKRSAHMELTLHVEGSVKVECDRCLEEYWQEIDNESMLLMKFGDHYEELDDEVMIIPSGESMVDLDQLIYEFAHLALPVQRLHPENEEGESECDPVMLAKLGNHITDRDDEIDPRWSELGKLKSGLKN